MTLQKLPPTSDAPRMRQEEWRWEVRSEEDILMEVPKPVGDWRPIAREALRALGPGHNQQWLDWYSGLPKSTSARYWATGKAPSQRVDRMFATLREEAERHQRGDCSKARYLSQPHLGYIIGPNVGPRRVVRQPVGLMAA